MQDATGRDTAKKAMDTFAASFQALAADSDLGMYRWSFQPQLFVDYVNPAFEAISGYALEELRADPDLLSRSMPAAAVARFEQSRRGTDADPGPIEFPWTRPDGTLRWCQVREVQLRDGDGRLEAVIGVIRDTTAQRRQEDALGHALHFEREAADRLRRVDELRRLFLQAVSHELRTPLTSVVGFAATIRDRLDDFEPEFVRGLAERIHRQALRIEHLLDDLLDVERLSRGVMEIHVTSVDLAALVRALATDRPERPLELDLAPVVAKVDASKVERIVDNLIANSWRHAGDGAQVRVTLRREDATAVLLVDDDGPGIPDELRTVVFEPFEQVLRTADKASPGTGIGLTLVAEFARLHGGSAHVEDSPLGGARFVVRLPLAGPPSQAPPPATTTMAAAEELDRHGRGEQGD